MTGYDFFLAVAGYYYDPATETKRQGRERCARSLADAESWAGDAGVEYVWDGDSDGMYCVARLGDLLESVGGIDSTDNGYGRVIEAELAREILGRVRAETAGWAIR